MLKEWLAVKTGVPVEHMKLLVHGTPMKDDSLPLSAYGIAEDRQARPISPSFADGRRKSGFLSGLWPQATQTRKIFRIRMIGSKETHAVVSDRPDLKPKPDGTAASAAPPAAVSGASTMDEGGMVEKINEVTKETATNWGPKVDELEASLLPARPGRSTTAPGPASSEPRLGQPRSPSATPASGRSTPSGPPMHVWLSEMLLQRLLKLDSFDIPSEWTKARAARKEGVRLVQGLLGAFTRSALPGRLLTTLVVCADRVDKAKSDIADAAPR